MIRHFWKNRAWVRISLYEIGMGIIILLHYQQLDLRLPPALGIMDDAPIGLAYLILGILLLVNSLWDFYWHYIRLILISLSAGMWALLSASYIINMVYASNTTFMPIAMVGITLDILFSAYEEPQHKLRNGG